MNKAQKEKFEQSGWKVGTVGEFFELTTAEQALIETKLRLGDAVRALRKKNNLSQKELAQRMGSSQPRVAKLENRDAEISLEFQLKAIFAAHPAAQKEFSALIATWGGPVGSRAPIRSAAVRSTAKSPSQKRTATR